MTRKLPKIKRIKDMTPDEKKVLSQRIQLYGGVALIFILCALFLRFYNTRLIESSGILPTPRQIVEPIAVTYRAQDDPAWAQEVLGDTGYTMAQEGSLFCSLSMALETCGVDADPGALNRAFVDNDMYVNGNAADLTRLSELYPQIVFSAPRDFDGEDITQALVDGRACMVRVQKGESAHWLCVVGSTSEDFLVLDPAAGDGEARSLADFGNVFALALFDAN